jgi:hypothetical protein
MALAARFTAYSGSDWFETYEALDADTGGPLTDIDDALVEIAIRDGRNSTVLSGSTADGKIARPASGQVRWHFTAAQMASLRSGTTYGVGLRMTDDSGSVALVSGSLAFVDGEFE